MTTSHLPRRKRSRIAHFKQPFLVSVAGSALALGCGGEAASSAFPDETTQPTAGTRSSEGGTDAGGATSVSRGGSFPVAGNGIGANPPWLGTAGSRQIIGEGGAGGEPVVAGCPGAAPVIGAPCSGIGQDECEYGDRANCPQYFACENGAWADVPFACNPPPLLEACPSAIPSAGTACWDYVDGLRCGTACNDLDVKSPAAVECRMGTWTALAQKECETCPASMPNPGADCANEGLDCRYSGCEGPMSSTAECRFGQWFVVYSGGPACNPPPVIPVCPTVPPEDGRQCAYEAQSCSYECGSNASQSALCNGGFWKVGPGCEATR